MKLENALKDLSITPKGILYLYKNGRISEDEMMENISRWCLESWTMGMIAEKMKKSARNEQERTLNAYIRKNKEAGMSALLLKDAGLLKP